MNFPFSNSVVTSLVVLVILLPVAVLGSLHLRRKTGSRLRRERKVAEPRTEEEMDEHLPGKEMTGTPSKNAPEYIHPLPTQEEDGESAQASLRKFAAQARDENLRGLIESRLEDMEDEEEGLPQALAMVGLLDEIRILSPNAEEQDSQLLQTIDTMIRRQLEKMDAEVIDDDVWDISRQKAVEIRRVLPGGAEPVIAEKVASGLMFEGRVRRKQSVILHTEP